MEEMTKAAIMLLSLIRRQLKDNQSVTIDRHGDHVRVFINDDQIGSGCDLADAITDALNNE